MEPDQLADLHNAKDDCPDLTTEHGVRTYLAGTPFASSKIEALSGGTANYVFRIWLDAPCNGRRTLIVKHARPYVKDFHEIAFKVERQIYEVEALRRVESWIPEDAVVGVPHVHKFDEEAHVIVMDDAGVDSVDLKSFMNRGGPSLAMAAQIGSALGEFLGTLHASSKASPNACAFFERHEEAKRISIWAYYGRLVETLSGKSGVPKLEDPPLLVNEEVMEVLKTVADETQKTMGAAKDVMVMGDFWPGNLMVSLDDAGNLSKIFVLDWELAKTGLPAIEIGQFCAEIHFCRRFHEDVCRETSQLLLDNFFKAYGQKYKVDLELARRTLVHWGTHMTIIGPRVEWGDKERTRKVVLEGVEMIVAGYKGELKASVVGRMMDA